MRFISLCLLVFVALTQPLWAQSTPNLTYGQVPTAGQWNSYFAAKQDVLGYTPLPQSGGTMTGPLATVPSNSSSAGFTIYPGVAPGAPTNGDMWITGANLFYQANGATRTVGTGNGTVSGPGSSVAGDIAVFLDTTGLVLADGGLALPTSAIVGINDAQTLANKTLTTPNIGAATGTSLQLSGLTASSFVSTDGSKNLTTAVTPVTSFNTRTGAVVPANNDYTTQLLSTTNTAPASGKLGEVISCSVLSTSPVSIVTSTAKDICSVSLTAGSWACFGNVGIIANATATVNAVVGYSTQTSATLPTAPNGGSGFVSTFSTTTVFTGVGTFESGVSPLFIHQSSTANAYLGGWFSFSAGTPQAFGGMNCLRIN